MFGVSLNKGLNRLAQFSGALGAQATQGFPGQDAEPNLHLIQPTGRGGREVKMDIGVVGQPDITFLVRAIVVPNHVQFLLRRRFRDDLIHKLQELLASFKLGDRRPDLSGSHLQRCKQIERAMPLIGALVSAHDLAIVGLHVERRPTVGARIRYGGL